MDITQPSGIPSANELFEITFSNVFCVSGEVSWSTTEEPFTPEEEDAIVTLVVIVIGIIVAIVVLFSMGIFIDCKHQYVKVSNIVSSLSLF